MVDDNENLSKLIRQNEIIISLLGRLAFTEEKVRDVVTHRKRNPEKYIQGYNACDGKLTLAELAKIVGVKYQSLSPILSDWEEIGIVYEVTKPRGKFYQKIFPI